MKKIILLIAFLLPAIFCFSQIDSLDIKIGQMIMVGMSGQSAKKNSAIIKDIKKGIVGGVLLFEYNINPKNSQENLLELTNDLQEAAQIPLFISIDQEGGQVNRLKMKYGFPSMPSAQIVGQKNDSAYSHKIGNTIANSLSTCGINLNFAPDVDILNPNCPVLGKRNRCYSSNVKTIVQCAEIMIEEHKKLNIKTALKHFPGHGSSTTDSHLGLVDVSKTWSVEELFPYKYLIDTGKVDMIMTAHIINKKLDDSGLPATLSKKIVTGLLRKQFHYDGIVISDDMQMHAISKYYGLAQSLKLSINAGVDIVIFSNNIEGSKDYTPENIHATFKKLVLDGDIPFSRVDESYNRIMNLKKSK
jgi:beta-N-acetylhexosaminidase